MAYVSNVVRLSKEKPKITPESTKQAVRSRLEEQKARILALDTRADVHRGKA